MQNAKGFFFGLGLLLLGTVTFSQQLKLGKNPYVVNKSAVLELESSNQGLLFPRIADTAQINLLGPPDGMVIFYIPSVQLLLRTGGFWKPLTVSSALNSYWSLNGNGGTTASNFLGTTDFRGINFRTNNIQAFLLDSLGNAAVGNAPIFTSGINQEKFLVDGGAATTSFNLISGKGNINNYLQLNIQNKSDGNSASSDVVATNDLGTEANGINYIDMGINSSAYSNTSVLGGISNAYLYSTGNDLLIGNASVKPLRFFTGGTATTNERLRIDSIGNVGFGLTIPTAVLHLKAGTATANTAPLKFTSGLLMTAPQIGAFEFLTDKFYGTITTGTSRKEFTLNDAGLTSGRVPYASTNGRLVDNASMTFASSRLSTYLTLLAGTVTTAPLLMTSGPVLTAPVSGAIEYNGTHFYGTVGSSRFQLDQQAGTLYTGSNGVALIGNDFRNTFFTGIAGDQTLVAGTASGNSLTLSSTSNATKGKILFGTSGYNEAVNRLGLGNNIPTEVLDVTGNLKFSGALMPNNNAGTTGYYLASAGTATAPTWNVFDTTSIAGFSQKVRSLFSATAPITDSNGVFGITKATSSTNGYLSSTDWNTFNSKASSYTSGNLTETGSSVLTITGGTNAVLGSGTTLLVKQANGSQNGFLTSADWTTFNGKQTALTFGNVTGSDFGITGGNGAVIGSGLSLVLATVNANTGPFGDATHSANFTVNGKGLITAAGSSLITFPVTSVNTLTGAVSLGISNLNDATITTPTSNQVLQYNGTRWINATPSYISSAITSLNGLTAATQTFAIPGTTGTAPAWVSTGSVHTLNLPMAAAASVTGGLLSNTDWNTFNNKLSTVDTGNISNFYIKSRSLLSAGTGIGYNNGTGVISNSGVISLNGNSGILTMDTSYISSFSLKVRSLFAGTLPITYSNGQIGITQAGASTNGYLSSTDWNTFNGKLSSVTSGNLTETGSGILTITGGTNAVLGSGTSVQVKQATGAQSGFLSSSDWTTFNNKLTTVDTTNISGFSTKVRSLFSGTAPITYSNGLIGITQATTSTNGYLSSTDWNTFNGKAASYTSGNLTESGSSVLTITGGTNAVLGGGTTVLVKQASGSQSGFLSSGDWTTFNSKLSTIDTTNISNFYLKVRGEHTAGPGITYNNSTGVIGNGGVLSINGNIGALTMDTTYISSFSQKTRSLFGGTAPLTYANGQFGITQAGTSANGYLSSTDWNTFNNKVSAVTSGNLTEASSSVLTITGGTGAVLGSGTTLQVKQANGSQGGFLSSTDWTTFNSKLSTVDTTNISNFYVKVRSEHTAGTGITYNSGTGAIANSGVLSVNGNAGALTMDTTYISSFSQKTRSLFGGTAPLTYTNGQFGITQAGTSANGYLSSADWNTFNNKVSAVTSGNLTEASSSVLTITGGTGAVLGSGTTLQVKQANGSQGGFLSSTDWTTFNNKLSTVDTTNISNFYIKSRSLLSAGTGITYNAGTGVISSSVSTASSWAYNGNAVGAIKNFGTTDNYALPFITNNTEKMRLTTAGYLGIGNTSPGNYLDVSGTVASTGVSGLRLNGLGAATAGAANSKVLSVNSSGDVIVTTNPSASLWSFTGNSGLNPPTNFLGMTDDKQMVLKSNNVSFLEFGRRQTLGLNDGFTDYNDNDEKVTFMRSAIQFDAPAASFYKPKIFTDVNGNFRIKGSSAGTDYFEMGSTGTNNNGGFEFIIGDDGDEPMVFKSYNYQTGLSEIMRLQSGRMAVGSNAFDATNPEKLLIDAGATNSYNLMTGKGSIDNYLQINVKNSSATANASSDLVASSDNGSETVNFIDMGINSSAYSNTGSPILNGANNAYLYATGNDFLLGNATASKNMTFFTGGTALANERMRIDGSGNIGIGTITPLNKLSVVGTNPLYLAGVQTGSLVDSFLMINGGIVKKLSVSTLTNAAVTSVGLSLPSIFTVSGSPVTSSGTLTGTFNTQAANSFFAGPSSGGAAVPAFRALTATDLPAGTANTSNTWTTTGNSGTASGTNYLGTSNLQSLVMRTNGIQGLILDSLGNVGVGSAPSFTAAPNREEFLVDAGTNVPNDFINVISGKGSTNNYMQMNIQNRSAGTAASSDVVATNDLGSESANFIDMGINSTGNTSTGVLGGNSTGYLYSLGNDFSIGNGTSNKVLKFFTGGFLDANERMRIDGDGKVGIGTGTATLLSDFTLNQKSTASATTRGFRFSGVPVSGGGAGSGFAMTLGYNDVNNKQLWLGDPEYLGNGSSAFLRVSAGNGYSILDAITGNNGSRRPIVLGIGADASAGVTMGYDGNTTIPSSFVWDNGNMAIGNGYRGNSAPANGLIVQGNVGIGKTSASQALDVNGSINAVGSVYTDGSGSYGTNNGTLAPGLIFGGSSSGEGISSKRTATGNQYGIDFYTGSNIRMTVYNGGNVGIGTGSTTPTDKFTVDGIIAPFTDNTRTLGTSAKRWSAVYATGGVITTSDKREKTEIKNLNYGLKEVLALQPVSFNWKTTPDSDKQLGLIAQDVRKVIPEVVIGDEAKETLGMNYSELVPILINAIKEQQKQIDQLKEQILKVKK